MGDAEIRYLDANDDRLAYRLRPGGSPALMFLPGYASDMEGSKAVALDRFAERRRLAMLRFDYSGTGSSEGSFVDGTLGGWIEEALHMLDRLVEGPAILVGSSMGGWIALHLALHRPDRVQALVGIAAAPDFTDWGFSDDQKDTLEKEGRLEQPNPYGSEPYVTTRGFWQSGQQELLLEKPIAIDCPVRLVHGENDADVPLPVAYRLFQQLRSADVQLTIVKGGGHRLSEPHEIETILRSVASLLEPLP
jgi:pimeloyl-ACP methyl ester carboxylesterase